MVVNVTKTSSRLLGMVGRRVEGVCGASSAADLLDEGPLRRFLDEGRMADRVIVGRLTPSTAMPLETLWVGCDPGAGVRALRVSVTPQEARKRREKLLITHVRKNVELAKIPSPTPLSPIAESLSMLFKDRRVRPSSPETAKTIYYVTDALEHLSPPFRRHTGVS